MKCEKREYTVYLGNKREIREIMMIKGGRKGGRN